MIEKPRLEDFRTLRPALGRIAVEPLTTDEVTKTGIYLPYGSVSITTVGQVVAVSDPFESAADDSEGDHGPLFQVGDVVVYGKYVGSEVQFGRNIKIIIMREADVLATLHRQEAVEGVVPIHTATGGAQQ